MGDQRQFFRFRLPWLSSTASRKATEPQAPRPNAQAQSQGAAQPTTNISVQRPPFRPAGIAQAQSPPPQAQAPQARTEPQATAPPRAAGETRAASQPAAPARPTTQIRDAALPPSLSRGVAESRATQPASPARGTTSTRAAASPIRGSAESRITPPASTARRTQNRASSQFQSPSRAATQSRVASLPPSPSRTTSQSQQTAQTAHKPPSPSRLASQIAGQTSSQPSPTRKATTRAPAMTEAVYKPPSPAKQLQVTTEDSPKPPPSASQEEPKLAAPPQPSVEARPKPKSKSEDRRKTPTETAIQQPSKVAVQSPQASVPVAETVPISTVAVKTFAESSESNKREEGKKVEGLIKEKELPGTKLEAGETQPERLEVATEKPWITSTTDEKKIDPVSSTHPEDRHKLSNHHQRHVPVDVEQVPLQQGIREDISKFVHKQTTEHPKLPMDEESVRVVTLAGENRGAYMSLGSESGKKNGSIHIHRGYLTNPDDSTEATTDGEIGYKGKQPKDSVTKEDSASKAYVNSNAQSINNSIVFDSSVTERNPGVKLVFSHSLAEQTKPRTKSEPIETKKAEFNIIPAEKLTYDPSIRRRCLRGLFLEPSDSEPDNPKGPRRHGCKYSCGEKNKDKEGGIF
ncbi:hypothetical protein SLE2022_216040 [Rubroshorea leprosula]